MKKIQIKRSEIYTSDKDGEKKERKKIKIKKEDTYIDTDYANKRLSAYSDFSDRYNKWTSDSSSILERDDNSSNKKKGVYRKYDDNSDNSSDWKWDASSSALQSKRTTDDFKSEAAKLLDELESDKKFLSDDEYTSYKEYLSEIAGYDYTPVTEALTDEAAARESFGTKENYKKQKAEATKYAEKNERIGINGGTTYSDLVGKYLDPLTSEEDKEYIDELTNSKAFVLTMTSDDVRAKIATNEQMKKSAPDNRSYKNDTSAYAYFDDYGNPVTWEEYLEILETEELIDEVFKAYRNSRSEDVKRIDAMAGDTLPDVEVTGYTSEDKKTLEKIYRNDPELIREVLGVDVSEAYKITDRYFDYLSAKEQAASQREDDVAWAKENPVAATLKNFVTAPAQIAEYAGNLIDADKSELGRRANVYDDKYIGQTQSYSEGVTGAIDDAIDNDALSWLATTAYSGVTSAGQSYVTEAACRAIFGPKAGSVISLGVLGSQAAASSYNEAIKNGSTYGSAVAYSVATGVAEALMEKTPMDELFKIANKETKGTVKEILLDGLKDTLFQGLTEAGEELGTSVIDEIADRIINGDTSSYNATVNRYMQVDGLSEAEAKDKATMDYLTEVVESALGGFFGGVPGGAVATTSNAVNNALKKQKASTESGRQLLSQHGGAEALADEIMNGLGIDRDTYEQLFKNSEKLSTAKTNKKGEYSGKSARLADKVFTEALNAKSESSSKSREEIIEKKLINNGVTEADASNIANEINSSIEKGEGTEALKRKYSNNESVISVITDLTDTESESYDPSLFDSVSEQNRAMMSLAMGRAHYDMDYGSEDGRVDEEKSELGEVVRYEEIKNDEGDTVNTPIVKVGEREVPLYDIDLKADSIYSNLDGTDLDYNNGLINAYKSFGGGMSAQSFATEFKLAYLLGKEGRSGYEGYSFKMSKEAVGAAITLGKGEKAKSIQGQKNSNKRAQMEKRGREGSISTEKVKNKEKITDGVIRCSKVLSLAGYNIELFEDASETADRGSYDWDTNTIRLNVSVGTGRGGIDLLLGRTLSHELVHSIQRWNPEGYEELKGFIIEKMGDSFEKMVVDRMDGLGLDRNDAIDEVVAYSCEMMLRNSKSLTDFAKEHRTLFEKICDVVEEFIGKIRNAISSLYGDSTALHDEARFMELYADELQKVFDKALSDALNASEATVDHTLQSNANKKAAEDGGRMQYSRKRKRTFSYDELVSKDDIVGTTIKADNIVPISQKGIKLTSIMETIKSKCSCIQTKGSSPTYYVNVPDIGTRVIITRDGVKHGFFRSVESANSSKKIKQDDLLNARISLEIPSILEHSIEVNRSNRDNSDKINFSRILIGVARIEPEDSLKSYDYYAVRFVVHDRKDGSTILKEANIFGNLVSVNAKKMDTHNAKAINNTARTQSDPFAYSVSDFINDVKHKFDDTFSKDVYSHFNMNRRQTQHFSDHLQYSKGDNYNASSETENISPEDEADIAEYRKASSMSLIEALKLTAETEEERTKLSEYEEKEQKLDRWRAERAKLEFDKAKLMEVESYSPQTDEMRRAHNDVVKLRKAIRSLERARKAVREKLTGQEYIILDDQEETSVKRTAKAEIAKTRRDLQSIEKQIAAKKELLKKKEAIINDADFVDKLQKIENDIENLDKKIRKGDKELLELQSTEILKTLFAKEKAQAIKATKALMKRRQEESAIRQKKTAKAVKALNDLRKIEELASRPTAEKHIPSTLASTIKAFSQAVPGREVHYDERIAELEKRIKVNKDRVAEISRLQNNASDAEFRVLQAEKNHLSERIKKDKELVIKNRAWRDSAADVADGLSTYFDSLKETKNVYAPALLEEVKSIAEMFKSEDGSAKSINELTLDELEKLTVLIAQIKAAIKDAKKLYGQMKSLDDEGAEIIQEANRSKDSKERFPWQHKLREKASRYGYNILKPYELFEMTGSETLCNRYKKLQAGEGNYFRDVQEGTDRFSSAATKYHITKSILESGNVFTLEDGTTISLSNNEAMSIYLTAKRKQGLTHLLTGGFRLSSGMVKVPAKEYYVERRQGESDADFEKRKEAARNKASKKIRWKNSSTTIRVTFNDISKISSAVLENENLKGFADSLQSYMSTELAKKGNHTSLVLHDIKKFMEPDYFPLITDSNFRKLQIDKATGEVQIIHKGFTKQTVPDAGNPLVIEDMTEVFGRHVNEMALYNAFAIELENMKRVLNYQTFDENGNPVSVTASIGTRLSQEIVNFIREVNGGVRSESTTLADKLIALNKVSKVGASLSVIIQQPSAVFRSLAMIDPKYFVIPKKSYGEQNVLKLWAEMEKYTDVAGVKGLGGVDINTSRGIIESITDLGWKGRGIAKNTEKLIQTGAFGFAELGDKAAWMSLWNACKKEAAETYSGNEILENAGKRFNDIVNRTQVYDSVFSRAKIMRSKSTYAKMVSAFMAEPITTANMMIQACRDIKSGDPNRKKAGIKAIGSLVLTTIINNALVAFVYAERDDDEDESYWEKYIEAFESKMIGDILPFNYLPYWKDAWSALQGYDVERMDMSLISDLASSVLKIATTLFSEDTDGKHEKVKDVWLEFGATLLDLTGIPISNGLREIYSGYYVWKNRNTKTTDQGKLEAALDGLVEATPAALLAPSDKDADKLYRAIVSDDTVRYNQIANRLSKEGKSLPQIQSLISKGIQQNDERVTTAAKYKMNGKTAESDRVINEIMKDGFAESFVTNAVNSKIKELTPDDPPDDEEYGIPNPTENDEFFSRYSADDIFANLEAGDTKEAQWAINDIFTNKYNEALTKLKDGEDEEDAEKKAYQSLRNMISADYRDLYKAGDSAERERIKELLLDIYVNGEQLFKETTIDGWGKE